MVDSPVPQSDSGIEVGVWFGTNTVGAAVWLTGPGKSLPCRLMACRASVVDDVGNSILGDQYWKC